MLGQIEGKMRRGQQRMRWLESITDLRALSLQLCLTLSDPMDYGLPGSSVHGILQAGILEWVAVSFSITDLLDMNLSKLWEIVEDRGAWCAAVHWVTESDMT